MNQHQSSDSVLDRKRSELPDYDYSPEKKIHRPDGNEDKESERSNEVGKTNSLKQGSSTEKNFAKKYLLKHGYKEGSGLGKYQNGIIQPVEASNQKGRRGLGFEPLDLKDVVSKYDPSLEEVSLDEEILWLMNEYGVSLNRDQLESWVKIGPAKSCIIGENSRFCDPEILRNVLSAKNVLDSITEKDLDNSRRKSNPFESIQKAIFLNRAAVKMANMDAILDRMFTEPKDTEGVSVSNIFPDVPWDFGDLVIFERAVVGPNELLYFADVCAGPGGFSEYVLFRKKWRAKGFGFTLRNHNDFAIVCCSLDMKSTKNDEVDFVLCVFRLDQFGAGPPETFEPHYGATEDGNVFVPENILSFKNHVLKYTDSKGVHFMMADGGVEINENFNDQELISKKLYLCQCIVALHIVRTEGHFVVKLFDLFTNFSVGLLYLMYRSFRQISIIKPNSSRPANSERYLVCKWKREDCSDIADFLFDVNKRVPSYEEKSEKDVLELVPEKVLLDDDRFYEYITASNNKLGKKQVVSLHKLAAFSENANLKDERQQELRKASLKKWDVPDEARADPKKCDSRTKWTELVGSCSLSESDTRRNKIESVESFREKVLSKHSWYGVVVSGDESNNTCALYLGLGRNNVQKYEGGKWVKPNCGNLCLPSNTLVYGETVYEYLGEGRRQRKIFAFHIIDALCIGGEDIRHRPFTERLEMCRLFAKSLHKETFPVRVKRHYLLAKIHSLWEDLVPKYTKSSNFQSLCFPLETDIFCKAGGIIFIKDTRGYWDRYFSNTFRKYYLFQRKKNEKVFEEQVRDNHCLKEYYGDFTSCFETRLLWWWGDGVVVHKSQNVNPDPSKMQGTDVTTFVDTS